MTSSKKHGLVGEVESLESLWKKITTRRHEGGGVIVEKKIKSQRIFHKNYCDLLTAITHTKILAAYFIISDKKKLKYKCRIYGSKAYSLFRWNHISMFLGVHL